MIKIFQKCLEVLPGGAMGGFVGGLVAFLIWDGPRADACNTNGFSATACASAADTRNAMIAVLAAVGAILGAIATAGYQAYNRSRTKSHAGR
jgi:hypothetical protein